MRDPDADPERKVEAAGREPRPLADPREHTREACIAAACDAYEDAAIHGLCAEGAFEAAVGAMRRLDVASPAVVPDSAGAPLAARAVAATGAIAADLLEEIASHAARVGEPTLRRRARTIAGRAALLRAHLASIERAPDGRLPAAFASNAAPTPLPTPTPTVIATERVDSALEIARRGSQVATLVAELAARDDCVLPAEVSTALRLARSATESALALAEATLRAEPHAHEAGAKAGAGAKAEAGAGADGEAEASEAWIRDARRRAWRVGLTLHRAVATVEAAPTSGELLRGSE